jgi:hypothetical protein
VSPLLFEAARWHEPSEEEHHDADQRDGEQVGHVQQGRAPGKVTPPSLDGHTDGGQRRHEHDRDSNTWKGGRHISTYGGVRTGSARC